MRLPRIQFTVRALVVAIALTGTAFGLFARRSGALAVADLHESKTLLTGWACSKTHCRKFYTDRNGKPATPEQIRSSEWHTKLAEKYRMAANCPWLPIQRDPPEPK